MLHVKQPRDKAVRRPQRSLYASPISWRTNPPRFPMPSRPFFSSTAWMGTNGTKGERADGRCGGLCGDGIGCCRPPRLPASRPDGQRKRLAIRRLRLRLVLHVRWYQVFSAVAAVEAGCGETRLWTRASPRCAGVSKAVACQEIRISYRGWTRQRSRKPSHFDVLFDRSSRTFRRLSG